MKYLEGYLSAIPDFEKKEIINELNKLFKKDNNNNTFSLINEYSLQTRNDLISFDKKPSDTYNDVFNPINEDIQVFNSIINSLSNNINVLDELIEALIEEINLDISNTEEIINNIKLKLNHNQEVLEDKFYNTLKIESNDLATRYLYQDRDGSFLNKCSINNQVSLKEEKIEDLLHKNNGETQAKILLKDYRGVINESDHIIEKAIDNNKYTYWDASAFTLNELTIPFKTINKKGHFLEIKILLPKHTIISELQISHISSFPITIHSIIGNNQEILSTPIEVNTDIIIPLNNIIDHELTIILNQPNYILKTITENEKEKEISELWNKTYNIKNYTIHNRKTFDYYYKKYKDYIKSWILKWKAGIFNE